jgi:hypothetical protein
MSTAVVFFDIEKAFDTTLSSVLLYKLSELKIFTNHIELNASFLTDRKSKVLVGGKFSTPREIVVGVPEDSILVPVLYSPYINDAPAAPGTHLALFADNIYVYMAEKRERHVLCKLQRGLTAVKLCHEH